MILISGADNFCLVHVSLVPVLNVVGEQVNLKTEDLMNAMNYLVS